MSRKKAYDRPLQHKEYLKLKYLTGSVEHELETKRKKNLYKIATKCKKIRIVDDDIDLKKLNANGSDDEIYYGTKEEKPTVAAVIDERPAHLRRKDIDTNQWKTIGIVGDDESFNNTKVRNNESRKRYNDDDDLSPPREAKRRHDSDSDLSPPRELHDKYDHRKNHNDLKHNKYDKYSDDLSPPRNVTREYNRSSHRSKESERRNDDRDLSPPRRRDEHRDKRSVDLRKSDDDSHSRDSFNKIDNSDRNKHKRSTTLSGKRAGLSDASVLKEETEIIKKKEEKFFASVSDELSGRSAKTVFRDKTGKVRDLDKEAMIKRSEDEAKAKVEAEKLAKYEKWGKGIVQQEQRKEKLESDLYEMTKPLARYENDEDLDKLLRERDRDEDPMLAEIKKKNAKKSKDDKSMKPIYNGPAPPPMNRFNIKPGYRWDGVDRSNGFEKRFFERISNKAADREEAYKWSTEDM